MAKLPRVTNRRFGADIDVNDIGQFGSVAAGEKTNTKDVSKIQELAAWLKGWSKATMSANKYPTMQERNGVDYVHAYQIDYMLKEGVPEYDSKTEYNVNSIVKGVVNNEMKLFSSLLDENVGQDLTNESAWKELSFGGGSGLEIGDIGIAPLGIDETKGKRRYLNGQLIIQDQYIQFTNKVKSAIALYPSLACTESEWQTTALLTVGGQVGKFVVDDEAGTIRLPKIIMPIQGLTDLSKLGQIVEAGLPNAKFYSNAVIAEANTVVSSKDGGFEYNSEAQFMLVGQTARKNANDKVSYGMLSASNSTYGNSNTVQQEQIQYPYFIQVATGAETEDNIINEIELNNPFSLLDYKFSEYELNNLSWLRSNGQWNSKAIYPAVYDLLLKIYNGTETKAGVSVKLATEAFTDYDFVLNTAEETFRLQLKVKLASSKAVVGNGKTVGWTANGSTVLGTQRDPQQNGLFLGTYEDTLLPYTATSASSSISPSARAGMGITADPTKSGLELSDSDLYLYFYVGETVQNANLINAGRIEEKLVEKLDRSVVKAYITETYVNGKSWYRIYSDGWCEQGGEASSVSSSGVTVNFLKPFDNTNYVIVGNCIAANDICSFANKTTNSFFIDSSSTTARPFNWQASGYTA